MKPIDMVKIDAQNLDTYQKQWGEFVDAHKEATFDHTWVSMKSREFQGYAPQSFLFLQENTLVGLLPMYSEQFLFLRRYSTPGLLSKKLSFEKILPLIKPYFFWNDVYLTINTCDQTITTNDHKKDTLAYTFVLDLKNKTETDVWQQDIEKESRNLVRKAEKNGLTSTLTKNAADVEQWYPIYVKKMTEYRSKPYPREYFAYLLSQCPQSNILLVLYNKQVIAGAFLVVYNNQCSNPYAASDSSYLQHAPNNFMYWKCIAFALKKQCTSFDFGPSLITDRVAQFKQSMGGKPYPFEHHIVLNKLWYGLFKIYRKIR